MKFTGFVLDELERTAMALREDGAIFVITYRANFTEPTARLLVKLPNEEPADTTTVA